MLNKKVLLGVVAYSPSVANVWNGMKACLAKRGVELEYKMFPTYEEQLRSLYKGEIEIAWNGPVAHVRARKNPKYETMSLGMRDVDVLFETVAVSKKSTRIVDSGDLQGKRIATGSFDSPQAYLIPMQHLIRTMDVSTVEVLRFDYNIGLHGDDASAEMDALKAVHDGQADVAFVSRYVFQSQMGKYADLSRCEHLEIPSFHHCQFDAFRENLSLDKKKAFQQAVMGMRMENEEEKKVLLMEGCEKSFVPFKSIPGHVGALEMLQAKKAYGDATCTGYSHIRQILKREEFREDFVHEAVHTKSNHPFKSLVIVDKTQPLVVGSAFPPSCSVGEASCSAIQKTASSSCAASSPEVKSCSSCTNASCTNASCVGNETKSCSPSSVKLLSSCGGGAKSKNSTVAMKSCSANIY